MVKIYKINLQQSYEDRWRPIIKDYQEYLPKLKHYIDTTIYNIFLSLYITNANLQWFIIFFCKLATWTLSWFIECPHWKEVKTLSWLMDIDFYYLLWMQYWYELNMCGNTTIVLEKNNNVYVFSTVDWDLDLLKYITINIEVYRGSKHLYSAVTWIGYTGILRGIKQIENENIALLVNYRHYRHFTMPSFSQMIDSIFHQYSWNVGVLLRNILENENNYEKILKRVTLSSLFSPTYIIVASSYISHCCTVVRESKSFIIQQPKSFKNSNQLFLIQTNCDNWLIESNQHNVEHVENITNSIERYHQCIDTCYMLAKNNTFNTFNTFNISLNNLIDIFLRGDVLNYKTIYTLVANLNHLQYKCVSILSIDENV